MTNCHNLIDENCAEPREVVGKIVGIFLKAMCNKNLLQVAKSSSAGAFQGLAFHASLFGYLAQRFKRNMIDGVKDTVPTVLKTVKKVVAAMKELFFVETHDKIRDACALSFQEILDNCFVDYRYQKDKLAKDLIFHPIFEELSG